MKAWEISGPADYDRDLQHLRVRYNVQVNEPKFTFLS